MMDGIHMSTEYWWNYVDSRLPPGLRIRTYENDVLHGNSITIAPKYLGLCTQYIYTHIYIHTYIYMSNRDHFYAVRKV